MTVASKPTQEFVPIQDVKDGIIILKDKGMRAILLASSLNFSLKSEDEKAAIILQFQDFLNSLDFSIQIFIESRRYDIRPYLALLEELKKTQTNDLMKIQIEEYIGFIRSFTEQTNIMTKSFFVVIPYSPAVIQTGKSGFAATFLQRKGVRNQEELTLLNFEEHKSQLEQRLSVVEQGLMRCGVRVARLGSEEIVELLYKIFNPGETERPIQSS